jgi:hypothetical protein
VQLINMFRVQLQIYNVTFLALTDANSSNTSLKLMVFAISYSLLEGQLSRERIWPLVLCLFLGVSQKYIPQSKEFTYIKYIVISRCAPSPLRPRQLPCLPTPRPGYA